MEKMSTLTFPDGSTYEIVDNNARLLLSQLSEKVKTMTTQTDVAIAQGYNAVTLNKPNESGNVQPLFIGTSTTQKIIVMSHNSSVARVYSEYAGSLNVTFTVIWLIIKD